MKQAISEDKIASLYAFFSLIVLFTFSKKLPLWSIWLIAGISMVFAFRKFIRNKQHGKSKLRFYIALGFIVASVIMGFLL